MVVRELRKTEERTIEDSKEETKEEPKYRDHYYTIRRSKSGSKFNFLIKIESDKWVKLDDEAITDSLSWGGIEYSKATILFYSKA